MKRPIFILLLLSLGSAFAETPLAEVQTRWNEHITPIQANIADERHMPLLLHHGRKTPKAVLVIHGIFESPHYFMGIINGFYKAGHNVVALLLPGHWEKDPKAMNHINARQWLEETDFGYEVAKDLGDEVILVGHSLGGLLATEQAMKRPHDEVSHLIAISPALKLKKTVSMVATLGHFTGLNGNMFDGNKADNFDMPLWLPSAGTHIQTTIKRVVGRNRSEAYARLTTPLLLTWSEFDEALDVKEFEKFFLTTRAARKDKLFFDRETGIGHTNISKSHIDVYLAVPDNYNPQFNDMLKRMLHFVDARE